MPPCEWLLLGLVGAILAAAAAFALRQSSSESEVIVGAWEYFVRDATHTRREAQLEDATASALQGVITNSFWAPGRREPLPGGR